MKLQGTAGWGKHGLRGAVAAGLADRHSQMAGALLDRARAELPLYTTRDAKEVDGQIRPLAEMVLNTLTVALSGDRVEVSVWLRLGQRAETAALAEFPLHELLRCNDFAAAILWEGALAQLQALGADPIEVQQAAMDMSVGLLDTNAKLSATVSEAHVGATRELKATGEQSRREVFDELLSGTSVGLQALRERAERAGYTLGTSHVVAILSVEHVDSAAAPSAARIDQALRGLPAALGKAVSGAAPAVQTRGAGARAIFAVPDGTHDRHIARAIQTALEDVELPAGTAWTGAVGRVERAMPGIVVSYGQAERALSAARATGAPTGIASYSDLLPTMLLLEDPALATDIFMATVEPLFAHDAEYDTDLVLTLAAYLEERGVLAATAKRLYVHRHTLASRLERIEAVTGLSLRSREDLVRLELGLRAQGIVGERLPQRIVPAAGISAVEQVDEAPVAATLRAV